MPHGSTFVSKGAGGPTKQRLTQTFILAKRTIYQQSSVFTHFLVQNDNSSQKKFEMLLCENSEIVNWFRAIEIP